MRTTCTATRARAVDAMESVRVSLAENFETGKWDLPVLPDVAARVLSLTEDPDSEAQELAKLIQRDPSLAGHILRIANSPYYSPRSPIVSLQQAVAWMGLFEISEIAFSVAIRAKIFNVPGQETCVETLWKQSYATAIWCKEIARITRSSVDTAYLCGLLHQIGIPIVLQSVSDILQSLKLALSAQEIRALAEKYHIAVAGQAVSKWGLPAAVPCVISHWRDFAATDEFRHESAMVSLAHNLSERVLSGEIIHVSQFDGDASAAELNLYAEELESLLAHQDAVKRSLECV